METVQYFTSQEQINYAHLVTFKDGEENAFNCTSFELPLNWHFPIQILHEVFNVISLLIPIAIEEEATTFRRTLSRSVTV